MLVSFYIFLQSSVISHRVENTHSTEKALLKVQYNIILSMDRQEVALLVLIDLSAATERGILLETVRKDFGVIGDTQKWLASYLSYRKQSSLIKNCIPDAFNLGSGVPQGSCLGPLLFLIYAAGLFKLIDRDTFLTQTRLRRRHSDLSFFSGALTGVSACCAEEYRELCC